MIESRGSVHQGKPLRQIDTKPPLIFAPAYSLPIARPIVPPRRETAGNRLQDQHWGAASGSFHEIVLKPAARGRIEFINRECGNDCCPGRNAYRVHVCALHNTSNAKLVV